MKVAVIGGGIAGVSAAYHLSLSGAEVILLEQESTLAYHSTGRSAAIYFENYGADANRPLTRASRPFFDDPPAGLVDHGLLKDRGALWVGRPDQIDSLSELLDEGSPRWLEPEEAVAVVPVLRPEMIGGAIWESEALDLDVAAIHQGFVRGLRAAGGRIHLSSRVSALEHAGDSWTVVADGGPLHGGRAGQRCRCLVRPGRSDGRRNEDRTTADAAYRLHSAGRPGVGWMAARQQRQQ